MSDNSFGNLISGIFLGGLAGYVIGTLYAPKEGEAMRSELKEKYLEKEKFVEGKVRDFLAREEEDLNKLKERIKEIVNDWEGELGNAKGKVKEEYAAQKERLLSELDKLEAAYEAGVKHYKSTVEEEEEVEKKPRRRKTSPSEQAKT